MHHSTTLQNPDNELNVESKRQYIQPTYKLWMIFAAVIVAISSFPASVAAQVGDYFILDDDSYLEIADNNALDFSTNLSVEAWINLCDVAEGTHTIISKSRCGANQSSYSLRIVAGGKLQWRWSENGTCSSSPFDGGLYITDDAVVAQPNIWYHIAAVHTPTSVHVYVNGVEAIGTLQSGNYSTIFNSNQPLRIGASIGGPTGNVLINFLNCFIDEVRLWDYPLSAAEVAAHAAEQPTDPEMSGIEPGLTAYYSMGMTSSNPAIPPAIVPNKALATGTVLNSNALGGDADSPLYVATGIDLNNLDLGPDRIVCANEELIIDLRNAGLHFIWSDNSTEAVRHLNQDGTYSVTATLGNCWRVDTLSVSFEGGIDTIRLQQCGGDPPYFLQGALRYVSGTYYDTIPTNLACDSVRVTFLDISEYLVVSEEISLCEGEQFELNTGIIVSNSGLYFDTLKQQNGNCDSLIKIIQFEINDFVLEQRTDSICWGESKWLEGQWRNRAGVFYDTTYTSACDTIYQTQLVSYDCRNIGCQMVIPDAFSPNSDGINDYITLLNPCEVRQLTWAIYDRLGRRVFATEDPTQTWDGNLPDHQTAPVGVYAYAISFEAYDEERGFWRPKTKSGNITLLR